MSEPGRSRLTRFDARGEPKRDGVRLFFDVVSLIAALFVALYGAWFALYAKAPYGTSADYLATAATALGAGFLTDSVKNAVTGFSFTTVKDFVTKRGA